MSAVDLDGLSAAAAVALAPSDIAPIRRVIMDWSPAQAVANLLMHSHLIPNDLRADAILRALREAGGSYLALAASVGLAASDPDLTEGHRNELVEALLDVVASSAGIAGERAAVALFRIVDADDLADLAVVLGHPNPVARRGLQNAIFAQIDASELSDLLSDREQISASIAATARKWLAADGVDLGDAVGERHRPPLFSPLPALSEWSD